MAQTYANAAPGKIVITAACIHVGLNLNIGVQMDVIRDLRSHFPGNGELAAHAMLPPDIDVMRVLVADTPFREWRQKDGIRSCVMNNSVLITEDPGRQYGIFHYTGTDS